MSTRDDALDSAPLPVEEEEIRAEVEAAIERWQSGELSDLSRERVLRNTFRLLGIEPTLPQDD